MIAAGVTADLTVIFDQVDDAAGGGDLELELTTAAGETLDASLPVPAFQ